MLSFADFDLSRLIFILSQISFTLRAIFVNHLLITVDLYHIQIYV